ncbi:hypothetical protein BKA82DRAFT_4122827 [Pisolithus tinctorius]|nr:hypothetical protein BKA82DRAFT_4122827 [Pisolithus tinctorius]
MSDSVEKPSAIISVSGLNTCSRARRCFLVPPQGDSLVSHLRIVDKFSVSPPTTYLGSEFPKVLARPEVEYRQANLTIPSAVASAFDPPAGQGAIAIKMTFNVSRNIALEAAKRNVKAYVRLQHPYMKRLIRAPLTRRKDAKPVKTLNIWWHETLRMLASIENLNLVILRIGFVYGPYVESGLYALVITVASVYGYMKKPMKTIGMGPLGRKEANAIAGEKISFHNDKGKVKEVAGTCSPDAQPVAPIFNVVDDSETTLAKGGAMITQFFGTTFEFYSSLETAMAKVAGYAHTINAYMDKYALSRHRLGYSNDKIKRILGYQLKRPKFCQETLQEVVDKWKAEGSWPIVPNA